MRKRVWTTQPPAGTPIDWDSPLSEGLVDVIEFYGAPRSKLLGTAPSYFGTSQKFGAPFAGAVSFDTTASYGGVAFNRSDLLYGPRDQTILLVGSVNAFSAKYAGLFGTGNPSGGENCLFVQYAGTPNDFYIEAGSGGDHPITIPIALGLPVTIAVSATASSTSAFLNGELVGTATAGTAAVSSADLVLFGERTQNASYATEGRAALLLFYGGVLQGAEHALGARNPWQIYHRRQRTYSIVQSTGNNGTAAITEGTDTVSASGNIQIAGTAAITEGADTSTASGNLLIPGTASITEGHDTVAATGSTSGVVVGTASITEGQDAVSASGSLRVSGTASITEGHDAVAATGSTSGVVVGTAAITEGHDSVSASGNIAIPARAAITEGFDAVLANGTIIITGSSAITEGRDFVLASGTAAGSGTIDMPNVVGQLYDQALLTLQNSGVYLPLVAYAFAPSSISVAWAKSNSRPGTVIAQSVPAGTGIPAGSPITLTVAQFPFSATIDMPPDWIQT